MPVALTKRVFTVRQFLDAYKKDGIKAAVHAPTKEQAKKLFERFAAEGALWCNGSTYSPDMLKWNVYCSLTCYSNCGEYCSKTWYQSRGVLIIEADQLVDLDAAGTGLFCFPGIC